MDEVEALVPESKLAEARALWEIASLYIALAAAARTISGGSQSAGSAAAGGYRASKLLAEAYYRLLRATWTGYTLSGQGREAGDTTSLRVLYSEFEERAYRAIPKSRHADTRERVRRAGANYEDALRGLLEEHEVDLDSDDERYSDDPDLVEANEELDPEDDGDEDSPLTEDRDWSDDEDIEVEDLEDPKRLLKEIEDAEAEELKKLKERVRAVDAYEREQAKLAKKRQMAARRQAAKDRGKRAGAAMKAAQQGGRTQIATIAAFDKRAVGWVSVPRGDKPCYWCMMLASRGLMLYRSDMGARTYSDLWHDNCKCVTEPVFSRDHYFTSPTFERNRMAYKLWDDFTNKRKKRIDMKAWRSYFDTAYRKGKKFSDLHRENARKN